MKAVSQYPESINQSNALGQRPLHLSVFWPEGLQYLLRAGANVDAVDYRGFTAIFYASSLCLQEPLSILAGAHCALYRTLRYEYLYNHNYVMHASLLQYSILRLEDFHRFRLNAVKEEAEAVVDALISIVAERRRILEDLVRSSLDSFAIKQILGNDENVLDCNASYAIWMLGGMMDVPAYFQFLTRDLGTVYHIFGLTMRHVQILWDAGFHDIDDYDGYGLTPLMRCIGRVHAKSVLEDLRNYCDFWELVSWFVGKGADLHRLSKYIFLRGKVYLLNSADGRLVKGLIKSRGVSSTTAMHYLASRLGCIIRHHTEWIHGEAQSLSDYARRIQAYVLSSSLPDDCSCTCSIRGCIPYTVFIKSYSPRKSILSYRQNLLTTQALAKHLDVDQPSLAWFRKEMLRSNTFDRLELRHTCCNLEEHWSHDFGSEGFLSVYEDEEIAEMQEEQSEQLKRLEELLVEFETQYNQCKCTFHKFLGDYWVKRMDEVMSEKFPIDHKALTELNIVLRKDSTDCSTEEE